MNCVLFALSRATEEPIAIVDTLLRRYVESGWVLLIGDKIDAVKTPETIVDLAPALGFRSICCFGYGLTVEQWAATDMEPDEAPMLLLITNTHAVVTQGGRVFDNMTPDGLPAASHRYCDRVVERAIRLWPD